MLNIDHIVSCNALESKLSNFWKAFIKMMTKRRKKQHQQQQKLKDDTFEINNIQHEILSPSSSCLHLHLPQTAFQAPTDTSKKMSIQSHQQVPNLRYLAYLPVTTLNTNNSYYQNSNNQLTQIGRVTPSNNSLHSTFPANQFNQLIQSYYYDNSRKSLSNSFIPTEKIGSTRGYIQETIRSRQVYINQTALTPILTPNYKSSASANHSYIYPYNNNYGQIFK